MPMGSVEPDWQQGPARSPLVYFTPFLAGPPAPMTGTAGAAAGRGGRRRRSGRAGAAGRIAPARPNVISSQIDLWIWMRSRRASGFWATRRGCGCCARLSLDRFNVSELTGILGLAQSGVSRHLGLLKDAGLVAEERDGIYSYYRLARPAGGDDPLWRLLDARIRAGRRHRRGPGRRRPHPGSAPGAPRELRRPRRPRHPRWPPTRARPQLGRLVAGPRPPAAAARRRRRRLRRRLPDARGGALGPPRRRRRPLGGGARPGPAARRAAPGHATSPGSAATSRSCRWPTAAVDVVLLSQALHHAGDPARVLREAARVLRPGGRVLILDLRAHDEGWVRDKLGDRWQGFDERRIAGGSTGAGFDDVRVTVGARGAGDPFVVIVACGALPAPDRPAGTAAPDRPALRHRTGHPMTRTPLDTAARPPHPRARRRHGHDDPAPQARGARLPQPAAGRPSQGAEGQQRPHRADPARRAGGDPRGVPGRRRRHHRDQHLLEHGDRPGRLRPRAAGLRAEPRVGADRPPRRRRLDGAHARQAALRRRRARPDQQVAVDLAQGRRPGVPLRHLRRGAAGLPRAGPRPARRRRRRAAGRDHLRHAHLEGGAGRRRRGAGGARHRRCR